MDIGHWSGRWRSFLLDGQRPTYNLHQLERRGTKQFRVRKWWTRKLSGTVEQGWQRSKMERLAVFVRNVFCLWSAVSESNWDLVVQFHLTFDIFYKRVNDWNCSLGRNQTFQIKDVIQILRMICSIKEM